MRHQIYDSLSKTILALLVLLASGCHDSFWGNGYPGDEACRTTSGEEVEVEVGVDIPEMQLTDGLRSLSSDQEKDASDIHILAFTVPQGASEENEVYAYEPRIKSGPTLKQGKYYVKLVLNVTSDPQRLVFLANIPELNGRLPQGVTPGITKKDLYNCLVFHYNVQKGWRSNGQKSGAVKGKDYDLIPMWGESNAVTVVPGENEFNDYHYQDGVVRLYRALARVDVGLAFDAPAREGQPLPETNTVDSENSRSFDFKEIYVYRPAKRYCMAGDLKNNIKKPEGSSAFQVVAPTIPGWEEYYTTKEADQLQKYDVDPNVGSLVRTIYLPESRATKATDVAQQLEESTCIVIGGVYKGNNFNPKGRQNTDMSYYRVDFVKAPKNDAEPTTYLPILRNHRYRINIKSVDGPGHKTPKEAIENVGTDVHYSVSVWDENDVSKVITDGKYWLRLSRDVIKVGRYGGAIPITFQTNWPKGWRISVPGSYPPDPDHPEKLVGNNLLPEGGSQGYFSLGYEMAGGSVGHNIEKCKSTPGKETEAEQVTFYVPVDQRSDAQPRHGAFVVEAQEGKLKWYVQVVQTNKLEVEFKIFGDREMTREINFLTVHEEGYDYDQSITVDGVTHTPVDQGAYRTFYLYTMPYMKPDWWGGTTSSPAVIYNLSAKNEGGEEFYFWNYDRYPEGPEEWQKKNPGQSFKNCFKPFSQFSTSGNGKPDYIKYLEKDNLWVVTIANTKMDNPKEPFELRRNKYNFTLSVHDPVTPNDPSKTVSITRGVNLLQQEHNIVLYTDPALTKRISYDVKHPELFLMNGKEKTLYVKSNIEGYVKLLRQGQNDRERGGAPQNPELIPIEKVSGTTAGYSDMTISRDELKSHIDTEQDVFFFKANLGSGSSRNYYSFTTRNDIDATKKLIWGYGDWLVDTTDPFFKYKFREDGVPGDRFRTEFLCVTVQPEANSYVIELDNFGVFIPLSRINTVADTFYKNWAEPVKFSEYTQGSDTWAQVYKSVPTGKTSWGEFMQEQNQGLHHLDDDDEVTAEFIWTDYKPYERRCSETIYDPKSSHNSQGPIAAMAIIRVHGDRYLYIMPGKDKPENVANTLVAVRSGKHDKIPTGITVVDTGSEFPENSYTMGNVSKAILWSWHIMTVRKGARTDYMSILDLGNLTNSGVSYYHPGYMKQELGALKRPNPSSGYRGPLIWQPSVYRVLGMTYQWGRKDPFPKEDYNRMEGYANLVAPHLKRADGRPFRTQWLTGYRMTYKQSIENPTVAVREGNSDIAHWLVEAGQDKLVGSNVTQQHYQISGLWGGSLLGSTQQREISAYHSKKTPFDPCPYGFKIPAVGVETGMPFVFSGYRTAFDAIKAMGVNCAVPINNISVTESWNGPESQNGYYESGALFPNQVAHFHTTDPVYGGNGRSGAWELKVPTPYFSGAPQLIADVASKACVLPIIPVPNEKEMNYKDFFIPRARSGGLTIRN